MNDEFSEEDILQHYEKVLSHYNLSRAEIIAFRKAVKRIAAQVLDHYFDSLGDL